MGSCSTALSRHRPPQHGRRVAARRWIELVLRLIALPTIRRVAISARDSARSREQRKNDAVCHALPADTYVKGNATPLSTIDEAEALGKESSLMQTGLVSDGHAPLPRRPWILLHDVGPRTPGDRHRHGRSRVDNRRELVPGGVRIAAPVGRICRCQPPRLWEIASAESDVMRANWRERAGELRRLFTACEELGVFRGANDGGRTSGIRDARRAKDDGEHRKDSTMEPPPMSGMPQGHLIIMAPRRQGEPDRSVWTRNSRTGGRVPPRWDLRRP